MDIKEIRKELAVIEKESGKKFGDLKNPLLVSVRSGARVSMPGMMDTILNLGLNDKTVLALKNKTGNINNSSLKGYRKAYFRENKKYLNTPVYDRYKLSYGTKFKGPAIIEEHESTTVIGPKSILNVDSSLNLNRFLLIFSFLNVRLKSVVGENM